MTSASTIGVLSLITLCLWLLAALAAGVLLLMAYTRTRMTGFIWLFVAVVLWPAVARLANFAGTIALPQYVASHAATPATVGLIYAEWAMMESVIGGALLVTAAVVLVREAQARFALPVSPAAYGVAATPPYPGFDSSTGR